MDLILLDTLELSEKEIIFNQKHDENTEIIDLVNFDQSKINNYQNITIYSGLKYGFVSIFFQEFVINEILSKTKKSQIFVIFIETIGENAKIVLDWLSFCNQNYNTNLKFIAEISKENLKEDLTFILKNNNLNNMQSSKDVSNNVIIYTDGACSGNPGAGGWGAVLFHGSHKKEISGFEKETTNNKMEITAVLKALELLKAPCNVELYSDSAYVVNAIEKGWLDSWQKNNWIGSDKKPVKNIEYWMRLLELMKIHNVHFNKVKGHADNEFNNRCDELATGEITKHSNDI